MLATTADVAALLGPDTTAWADERLVTVNDLNEAFNRLEHELLRRFRADDHPSAAHEQHPNRPPLVLLTAAPTGSDATRLHTILIVGARLGIRAVLLGPWSNGSTWHVNPDGTVRSADRREDTATRLNVLDVQATRELLDTLAEAHGVEPTQATTPAVDAAAIPPPASTPPERVLGYWVIT